MDCGSQVRNPVERWNREEWKVEEFHARWDAHAPCMQRVHFTWRFSHIRGK